MEQHHPRVQCQDAHRGIITGRSALSPGASEREEQPEGRSQGEGEMRVGWSPPSCSHVLGAALPPPPPPLPWGSSARAAALQSGSAVSAPPSRNEGPICSLLLLEQSQPQLRASLFLPSSRRAGKHLQHSPCPIPAPPCLAQWDPIGHPWGHRDPLVWAVGCRGV